MALSSAVRSAVGKRVAVVLAGCGVYDGSEIQEAVFALNKLSKVGAKVQCFAPDKNQMHVINHTNGSEMTETRNVLVESARICRGNIQNITGLKAADFDAVVFPGGFGVAKNLSDLAVKGPEVTVEPETQRVIQDFHAASKPVGLCCIAPGLAAKALEKVPGLELTLGGEEEGKKWPYAGTVGAVKALGSTHVPKPVSEAHVDAKNKVITSPAYMCGDAPMHEIEESVVAMVEKTVEMA
uniref:DJ-1/PfpI domain-containing protein n=1 Tax=Pyrodinium bahamense TaxID=73915 RepID=A0A7S0FI14_9DINO